ncbi:Cap15 family CBASS effector [Nostoc sp.]|uniref:Cap15 family cyclic dinucleotide receptor domain-containing protein n=1 Tax=Nostoc sp. TaxID=1180 RepID=UPI002FFA966C
MHSYATDAKDRESIPLWLAAIAVAASLFLSSSLKALSWEVPWWVDAPSVMGFYGLLYQGFDRFLWYQNIGLITFSAIPNVQGTWVGVIHSSYGGGTVVPGIILYVRQSWSQINIRIVTEKSSSYSIMAAVNTQESSEPSLKYEYMNEPSALAEETMQSHRGTANLRLSPDSNTLQGDYFSGRGRQNIGTMEFKLISRELLPRDEALRQAANSRQQP